MFSNGVSLGTMPAKFIARTLLKAASGAVRWIVILPLLSSVSMPEISASGSPPER
jgi:hypothetical protein